MTRIVPYILALAVALTAMPSIAQTVAVRSGEHQGFSRLVLEFPSRPDWTLREGPGRAELLLSDGAWQFDLGDIFRRIPRTRIRAISAVENRLVIDLGCACRVNVFDVRGSAVAIDVLDGPPLDNVRATAADAPPPRVDDLAPLAPFDAIRAADAPTLDFGYDRRELVLPGVSRAPEDPTPAPDIVLPAESEPQSTPGLATDPADEVARRLAGEVARAATQGFLRIAPPEERQVRPADEEAMGEALSSPNLRLRLPGEDEASPSPVDAAARPACRSDSAYDVASWAPIDVPVPDAIGRARADVAEELDGVSEEKAVALARLYINLGFGAEARAVLAALAPRHRETDLLTALARLVDGETLETVDLLAEAALCKGRATLWAAVAGLPADAPEPILVALGELPLPLRRHLGPRIIEAFLAAGDTASAESARLVIARAAGPHGAPFEVAAARLVSEAQPDRGLQDLSDIAATHVPDSDQAVAAYLEVLDDEGGIATDEMRLRAESRAYDLRGSEIGARIEAALVRERIRAEDFDTAAALLRDAGTAGSLSPETQSSLLEDFVDALAARAPDAILLVHATAVVSDPPGERDAPPRSTDLAGRLLDLGFPRLAREFLPTEPTTGAGKLMEAKLQLLAGDPLRALGVLETAEDTGPDARRLRAEALAALGEWEAAADVLRQLGDPRRADDFVWRTGDWSLIAQQVEGPRADAAELLVGDPVPQNAPVDALLDASVGARARISALLATVSPP